MLSIVESSYQQNAIYRRKHLSAKCYLQKKVVINKILSTVESNYQHLKI